MNPETPQNTPQQNNQPADNTASAQPAPVASQGPVAPSAPDATVTPAAVPGKGLGIASFVVSLLGFGLIGLIMGIVARSQSKKAGFKNGFALAGIIIGILNILAVIGFIGLTLAGLNAAKNNTNCVQSTAADGTFSQNCTLGTPSTTTTE